MKTEKEIISEFMSARGKRGSDAFMKKYSPEQRREWARKGGRKPTKKLDKIV